ncbi:hypothetical protein A2U01_0096296, partial [Trifolium medium]|nr:hypothetical protein [Trifolium medium]
RSLPCCACAFSPGASKPSPGVKKPEALPAILCVLA